MSTSAIFARATIFFTGCSRHYTSCYGEVDRLVHFFALSPTTVKNQHYSRYTISLHIVIASLRKLLGSYGTRSRKKHNCPSWIVCHDVSEPLVMFRYAPCNHFSTKMKQ